MGIEARIREAITDRVSRARPAEDALGSISRRIARRAEPSTARRASVAIFALAITTLTTVALWTAFHGPSRQDPSVGEPTAPSGTSREPDQTACFESRSKGDFDGDGVIETASLYALVPGVVECGGGVAEMPWRFELLVTRASGSETVHAFDDCKSIDCQLEDVSDFDADGRAELVATVGPGASVSYVQIFRVEEDQVLAIQLDPPGDPEGLLTPGPILLGGSHNVIWQSGFRCQINQDGTRALIAWQARRDDGQSPWDAHFTSLELLGNSLAVVATEDRNDLTELPEEGSCP